MHLPFNIGVPELVLITVIVLIIFGVGRLGDVGAALGRSMREFRAAVKDEERAAKGRHSTQPKS